MINVATVNTKGISEDLSLIVKCCQIMVSEMMCQLLKLNNPCWSAVSDYNTDQRRGLIGSGKPRLGGDGTDNLHGSGVLCHALGLLSWRCGARTPLGTWLGRIDVSVVHGHVPEPGGWFSSSQWCERLLLPELLAAPTSHSEERWGSLGTTEDQFPGAHHQ